MITILLVNLVGVTIYVSGVGMCLRATKRTGNHGYLLLAAYFAAVLVVSSLDQVRALERGPDPAAFEAPVGLVGYTDRIEAEDPAALDAGEAAAPAACGAEAAEGGCGAVPVAKRVAPPPDPAEYMPTVSPPILPAILLVGVFLISRDDPRRKREETGESGPEEESGAGTKPAV